MVEAMTCSIFIASITATGWPMATSSPGVTEIEMIVPCSGASTGRLPSGPTLGDISLLAEEESVFLSSMSPCCRTANGSLLTRAPASEALVSSSVDREDHRSDEISLASSTSSAAKVLMKLVVTSFVRTSGRSSKARRYVMLVRTPSNRNSPRARLTFRTASS